MKASCVNLYLDHEKFGCGVRQYVALRGRKYVRLVEIATGDSARIPEADFYGAVRGIENRRAQRDLAPGRVIRRLRRNAKAYGNQKSSHVKAAIAALKEVSP